MQQNVSAVTPIFVVELIEPCIPFWEALGFQVIAKVPDSGPMQFAMLMSGQFSVMYQTHAGMGEDLKMVRKSGEAVAYLNVNDLAAIEAKLDPKCVLLPRRKTFYGAEEVWVQEPGGNLVGFAQHEQR